MNTVSELKREISFNINTIPCYIDCPNCLFHTCICITSTYGLMHTIVPNVSNHGIFFDVARFCGP